MILVRLTNREELPKDWKVIKTSSSTYTAYGAETSTGSPNDVFGYNAHYGYILDRETGLYLCQHRYYDPGTGRWLTRDPIGFVGGLNVYGYCGQSCQLVRDCLGFEGGGVSDIIPSAALDAIKECVAQFIDSLTGGDVDLCEKCVEGAMGALGGAAGGWAGGTAGGLFGVPIGGILGGIVGGIVGGITTGGVGIIPGIEIGAAAGSMLGGAFGGGAGGVIGGAYGGDAGDNFGRSLANRLCGPGSPGNTGTGLGCAPLPMMRLMPVISMMA